MANDTYVGDGAYAKFNNHEVIVYTSNGIEQTNTISLEPEALQKLVNYARDNGWKIK